MVAQTRQHNQVAFKDKLAQRGLSADHILKRLQNLFSQLDAQGQDDIDTNSLANARAELIHKTILLHKDQGVRAYTACCLAELLRLYAPDAPYTQPQLRDIFQFFVRQLKEGLKLPDSPYHNQYFHLLESLSTVKSAVLICDLPSGDELMLEFFTTFFYIVRRGTVNKKMEAFMADILVALLDECQSVPQTVLDTVLAQFMDKDTRIEQPAYRLAITVCNGVSDKLQRPVTQYFTDIIVDSATTHSRRSSSPANVPSSDDEDEDESTKFQTLQNAHQLIKRLHSTCPAILHGVIPQLAEELRVNHVNIRQLATQALGDMYADKNGQELVNKYPAAWDVWISRKNDKSVGIRLSFVESLRKLVRGLPVKRDALTALEAKLLDPDDKVRTAACKAFSQLDYESALHHVSEDLLRSVAGRFLDKKAVVRAEALNSLGKLYTLAYPEIENNDAAATKHFGWIPNSILEAAGQSPLVRDVVDRVWATHILPLTSPSPSPSTSTGTGTAGAKQGEVDEGLWTEKLLNVMRHLSDKSIDILISVSGIKEARPGLCERYLDACIKYNGGVIDEDEEKVTHALNVCIQTLTAYVYSNDHKASEDLHTFAKMNENRLFKLLKTCFSTQTDIKTLAKTSTDFLKRLSSSSTTSSPTFMTTITTLLWRGSLHIINHASIPTLLKKLQLSHSQQQQKRRASAAASIQLAASNAGTLLNAIAKWAPGMGRERGVAELGRYIVAGARVMRVGRVRRDVKISDKRLLGRVAKIALGRKRRLAKFAARVVVFGVAPSYDRIVKDIFAKLVEGLGEAEGEMLAAHVAALVEYARYAPEVFEERSDIVLERLVRRVINVPILDEALEGEEDVVEEWYEDTNDIPPLLWAKISTLKLFRHRCLNAAVAATLAARSSAKGKGKEDKPNGEHAGNNGDSSGGAKEKEKAEKIVGPVIKMLQALMLHEGAMSEAVQEDPKARSRMRLQASLTMLHLARMEIYSSVVMPNFLKLALTIQDPCYGVRSTFLNKLIVLFMSKKLPPPSGVIFFLTVHDPEDEVKSSAAACVRSLLKKLPPAQRVEYFELLFIRLLHTLAHHPDFSTGHEDLLDLAKYIQFYLDLVVTPENIALLYHLASKGKTVRDHSSFTHSENFYMLCELSQDLIKARAANHSWSIQSYPGKVRMPPDILRPLPNAEAANRILKTAFLPDETREWVATLSNQHQSRGGGQKRERKTAAATTSAAAAAGGDKAEAGSTASTGKRKSRSGGGRAANGSAKRSGGNEEEEEEEEVEEVDEEEEVEEQEGEEKVEEEESESEGEHEDEEGSDVEMEDVDVKGRGKGKGRGSTKATTKGKGKAKTITTTKAATKSRAGVKSKSKVKEEKNEEDLETREAKGLRTSARTRAKAQASRKRQKLDGSVDDDDGDDESERMET
ncbi:hypothetical protein D9756_008405 [Leucocoprinus leucothites]|uniref:Cohesin-associated protein Pds5 n=1 Tax=Leucocoprinus leucothites TaxID=201217 RepID=A0A8H5FVZ5_9AGAR|nr:hypothetical protein D9756_008405 [Leucoagaricus leucothites]